ncbi:MAG: response regulator [Acidimicrobiales bacterium]
MTPTSAATARTRRVLPRRVAIADDDAGVLHAMADLFRARPGWEVVGLAATGDALVDLVETTRPDVVVSDVYLPAGETPLFRRLHALAHRPQVVLAISARATASLRRKLRDAGADDLVRKGLDDPVVAVERLLER